MRAKRMTPDPDGPAKAAYAAWRQWHGTINNPSSPAHGFSGHPWPDLIENRKAMWRRVAAAARRDA
jgi:hypothetical protein